MRRSRRTAAVTLLTVGTLLGTVGTMAISAPSAPGAAPDPHLTLLGQDPWTALGGDLALKLGIEDPPAGATIRVTAYTNRLSTRADFDRITDTATIAGDTDQAIFRVDALPAESDGSRTLGLGLEAPDSAPDPVRLSLRFAGVYPLAIELRDADGRTSARFVTFVVVVDRTAAVTALGVAWVWPVVAAPQTLPGERISSEVAAEFKATGRLGRQVVALRRTPDARVTLVPSPETVQTWFDLGRQDPTVADTATALRTAVAHAQTIVSSYVPIDVPSLLNAGMADAVDTEIAQGTDTLARVLGTPIDTRTTLARPVDAAAVNHLHGVGADRLLIEGSALAGGADRLTIARPFGLQLPTGATVTTLATDSGLERQLVGDDAPALRAQRLLAGLSLVALEAPTAARAVVLANPDNADLSSAFIDAVFTGLRANPWLAPMTLDDVFARIPAEQGPVAVRSLASYAAPAPPVRPVTYAAAQTRLRALANLAPDGDSHITLAQRALLASLSSAWNASGAAGGSRAQLNAFNATVRAYLAQIQVPTPATITLTSRSGAIPVTFRNDTGQPVTVNVTLQSQKLLFPEGNTRALTLPPKSTTVRFAVESRGSGSFPLQLTVTSTDGLLTISDRILNVQSTASTAVTLVLMGGAAAFLALWWGFHIRRRHRRRTREA